MTNVINITGDIMANNPLIQFVLTAGKVYINKNDADACITFVRFRELFYEWCKSNSICGASAKMEREHYLPLFSEYGLDVVQDTRQVKGRMLHALFIRGLEENLASAAIPVA